MNKKLLAFPLLGLLAISSFGFVLKTNTAKQNNYQVVLAAETVSEYYSSIDDSLSGSDLLAALNRLNSSKRKKTVGYGGMKTFSAKCDIDPDGSGKIVGFYDNTLVGPSWDSAKTWNREHVWPNARGGSKVEGDAHMTRPASVKTNSDRGSKGFSTDSYDPGKSVAYYRGVASRIIFYAAIADTSLKIIEDPLNNDGSTPANSMGRLSDMLLWNLQYLPSDTTFSGANDLARRTELNRNEVIQKDSAGQGNRNPFIDHPEYACKIWGNTNDKTRSICSSQPTPTPTPEPGPDPEPEPQPEPQPGPGEKTLVDLEITPPTKLNYQVGETLDKTGMKVYPHYSDDTYQSEITNYTVSPEKFETAGETTVTVSATVEGKALTGSFKVNVSAQAPAKGCGGDITTTSVVLSSLAFVGATGIIVSTILRKNKKKKEY